MPAAAAVIVKGFYRNKGGVIYQVTSCPRHALNHSQYVVFERYPDLAEFVLPFNDFLGLGYEQVNLSTPKYQLKEGDENG